MITEICCFIFSNIPHTHKIILLKLNYLLTLNTKQKMLKFVCMSNCVWETNSWSLSYV